jgi:hypothetical protein
MKSVVIVSDQGGVLRVKLTNLVITCLPLRIPDPEAFIGGDHEAVSDCGVLVTGCPFEKLLPIFWR